MQNSLQAIRNGTDGLSAHRQHMLDRVPNVGDWGSFSLESLTTKDVAYITAKTGHEFAILRGKREDILFHGDFDHCNFSGQLYEMLLNKKVELYCHSHPGEEIPCPSPEDRNTLKQIGQTKSIIVSGLTGREIEFGQDMFDDF